MRKLMVVLAVLVTGCGAGRSAEKRYEIVSKHGTAAEKCTAAREVQRAYLDDRDTAKYQDWTVRAGSDCTNASLERLED